MAFTFYGILQIAMPFSNSFTVFVVLFTLMGVADGLLLCFIVTISCDLAESSKLSNQASGYYHAVISPTTIIGPVIAGILYQKTQSYDYSFYLGGISCLICAAIIIIFILFFDLFKEKRINA